MAAEGPREYDFTWTVRLVTLGVVVVLAAAVGLALFGPVDAPRWLTVAGAAAIAIGVALYARAIAWPRLVRRATLDDHQLRVVTASGREHVVALPDLVVTGLSTSGSADGVARLDHPGGALYLVQPPSSDLAERLLAAEADR